MSRHNETKGLLRVPHPVRTIPKRAVVGVCLAATLICTGCIGLWSTRGQGNTQGQAVTVTGSSTGVSGGAPAGVSGGASTGASTGVTGAAPATGDTAQPTGVPSRQMITVAVVGHVRFPGLVRAPEGLRVVEAVTRAGGLTSTGVWDGLNLAQKVSDGQQIVVGSAGKAGSIIGGESEQNPGGSDGSGSSGGESSGGESSGGEASGVKVSINKATAQELQTITGVGPKLAAAIVEYRTSHGPFSSIDQLNEVKGIGPAKLAAIKPQVVL